MTPDQDKTKAQLIDELEESRQRNTELEGAVAALREGEEERHALFRTMTLGVVFQDSQGGITSANPAAQRILGLTLDQLQGRTSMDPRWRSIRVDGTEWPGEEHPAMVSLRTGRQVQGAVMGVCRPAENTPRWIEIDSVPLFHNGKDEPSQVYTTFSDITTRKQAEETIADDAARFERYFELGLIGMATTSLAKGWVDFNDTLCGMFGYSREEFASLTWEEMTHPEDLEADLRQFNRVLRGEIDVYSMAKRFFHKDGSVIYVHISAGAIRETDGSVDYFVAFLQDTTERHRAEEERRSLEAQVQHSQKLESLGVLAGGIAHDFNNLMMTILGNVDLTLLDLPPGSPLLPNVREVEQAAMRAADLAQQMLAYSGKGTFVVSPLNVNEVVGEMAHLLESSISKKADLTTRLESSIPAIMADATQIRQVVMNLITNASEAIGEDNRGVITISTGVQECTRAYLTTSHINEKQPEGCYVYIEVTDTGCGMDEETKSRLFDPFFSTKFAGRGLGMAAALGIIRGHKGAIIVDTEPGKGSRFRALFPACAEEAEESAPTSVLTERGIPIA